MQAEPPIDVEEPGLFALVGQAGKDAMHYAKAEVAYVKAQAAERANHAWPGLAMLFAAVCLGAGALVALLVGLVFVLYAPLGGWAVVVVVIGALAIAGGLGFFGVERLRSSVKPPEAR